MKKVIVWGSYVEYDSFYKWFEVERLKGNMEIEAIVLNDENLFSMIDGIPVIKIEEILERKYDYLIDMNQQERSAVTRIFELLKIPLEKVIPVKVFGQPCFDFKRYIGVKESKISIIANNCWGGYTYNSLQLKMLSPFINLVVKSDDYFRMLGNLRYYMEQEPRFVKEEYEPTLQRNYPVIRFDDVDVYFLHYIDFDDAVENWNRRKARLNYDNLFVEMIIDTYEDIEKFVQLPYRHKIGFTTVPCNEKDVIYFPVIENGYVSKKYDGNAWNFFNHMAMAVTDEGRQYDILKMLNHEEDFMRASMIRSKTIY